MRWADQTSRFGPGVRADAGGFTDAALTLQLRLYKRFVASQYRVIAPQDLHARPPRGQLWISRKLDGELWFLLKRDDDVALVAYNGRLVHGTPLTDEARTLLRGCGPMVIAGELVAIPPTGRSRVLHVGEALADASEGFRRLRFRAFDLLEDGGVDVMRRPYLEKWPRLQALLGTGDQVNVVETVVGTAATASQCFQRWVGVEGAEGVVVRTEFGTTLKVKPSFTVDAVVVGFGEHMLQAGAELGELAVALMRDDGTFHVVGGVSVGWTLDQQLDLHQRLQKLRVPSTYRLPNHDGMLCRFVRPELVVEVKANELLDLDSHGDPLRRMVLRYDPAAGWTGIGPLPVASLVFPVFLGERRDKLVDPGCVGLEQIYQRAPFDQRHVQSSAVREQPRSVVVESHRPEQTEPSGQSESARQRNTHIEGPERQASSQLQSRDSSHCAPTSMLLGPVPRLGLQERSAAAKTSASSDSCFAVSSV